jgi:hypothetical protein
MERRTRGERAMDDEPDASQTYLLRLWRIRCGGKWQWRASVRSPQAAERRSFAGLEQCFSFLREQCEEQEMETGGHGEAETRGRREPKETTGH